MMQECILRHFKVFVEGRRGLNTSFKKIKGIAVVSGRGADAARERRSSSDLYANQVTIPVFWTFAKNRFGIRHLVSVPLVLQKE
jgi:hypothetical protein